MKVLVFYDSPTTERQRIMQCKAFNDIKSEIFKYQIINLNLKQNEKKILTFRAAFGLLRAMGS